MRWAVRVIVVLAGGAFVIAGLADPAGPPTTTPVDRAPAETIAAPLPTRSTPAASRSGRPSLPTETPSATPTETPEPADTTELPADGSADEPTDDPTDDSADDVPEAPSAPAPAPPEPTFEDAVVDASNAARTEAGLDPLARSECADAAAAERAAALVGTGRLEHAPLGGLMSDCAARGAGENLVLAAPDAGGMVRLWLDSPGHRANILSGDFTHIGVGCADDGRQRICAQVFLRAR